MFLGEKIKQFFQRTRQFIGRKLQDRFARSLGWLGISQALIRFSRLGATLLLPRFLTPEDYGLAALVLTTYEFTRTFTRFGLHAKLIQAKDDEIGELSNSAFWLNLVLFVGLFVLQCTLAFPVAWFYDNDRLILPICVLAITFLIVPVGQIQSSLIQRENRLKDYAMAQSLRYTTANILTAVFAVAVYGGAVGAILMLLRRRVALGVLILSLMGTVPAFYFSFRVLGLDPATASALLMSVALVCFALLATRRGWLR